MGEKDVAKEEDSEEREKWGSQAEFILSCLGYAVGLGNVWRFPYLTYVNGGGAFLIPYAIMLTFVGIPIFFIELSAGQYCGGGPMTAWHSIAPIFQGVGAGMMVVSVIGCIYYNMIIGWALYYMFASWQKVLPWSNCGHEYNTAYCYSRTEEIDKCMHKSDDADYDKDAIWFNHTCYNSTYLAQFDQFTCDNDTMYYDINTDTCNMRRMELKNDTAQRVGASEEYFNYGVLRNSGSIEITGDLQWDLVLVLLLAWILCYLCVVKGIKSSGKVVYFTATFPYLILVILLIRGVLLEGALEGIKFYIIPEWEKLKTAKVWVDAAGQIFFSLSVGMGGLMTFASYNKFNNNVYRDTLIVTIGNCLTSFMAGFAIFSILGHLGHILDKPVDQVVASGSGLAFIAYPEVVLAIEPPQLWATLFFFMLITLGLDSQFAGIENIMTAIVDTWPNLKRRKPIVALVLCVVMFILGLTQCTQAGVYWLELMSYYSSGWSLVLIAMAEVMVVAWCYLAKNIKRDIETMIGFKLYIHWWICWTFISPLLLLGILIFNFIDFTPLAFGDYVLEDWAQILGWLMAFASVAMIPIFAVIQVVLAWRKRKYSEYGSDCGKMLQTLVRPTDKWHKNMKRSNKSNVKPEASNGVPPYNAYSDISVIDKHNEPFYINTEPYSNGHVNSGFHVTSM